MRLELPKRDSDVLHLHRILIWLILHFSFPIILLPTSRFIRDIISEVQRAYLADRYSFSRNRKLDLLWHMVSSQGGLIHSTKRTQWEEAQIQDVEGEQASSPWIKGRCFAGVRSPELFEAWKSI